MSIVSHSAIITALAEVSFSYSSEQSGGNGILFIVFGLIPVIAGVVFYFFFNNKYRNQEHTYLFERDSTVEIHNLNSTDIFVKNVKDKPAFNLAKVSSIMTRSRLDDPLKMGLNNPLDKRLDGLATMQLLQEYAENMQQQKRRK